VWCAICARTDWAYFRALVHTDQKIITGIVHAAYSDPSVRDLTDADESMLHRRRCPREYTNTGYRLLVEEVIEVMSASDDVMSQPAAWLDFRGVMTWRRVYPGRLDQVCVARSFPAFLLADTSRAHDAMSITAELVSNALLHTRSGERGGWFGVEVIRGTLARIAVHDLGGTHVPQLSTGAVSAEEEPGEHGYWVHYVAGQGGRSCACGRVRLGNA
jgi:hypothetical protein